MGDFGSATEAMRIIDLFALQVFAKNFDRCNFRLLQQYLPLADSCPVQSDDHGSALPSFATAASASRTGSLKVQRGTVRIRSRPAKTPEVAAASGASSRKAASNSRPNPRKLSTSS